MQVAREHVILHNILLRLLRFPECQTTYEVLHFATVLAWHTMLEGVSLEPSILQPNLDLVGHDFRQPIKSSITTCRVSKEKFLPADQLKEWDAQSMPHAALHLVPNGMPHCVSPRAKRRHVHVQVVNLRIVLGQWGRSLCDLPQGHRHLCVTCHRATGIQQSVHRSLALQSHVMSCCGAIMEYREST